MATALFALSLAVGQINGSDGARVGRCQWRIGRFAVSSVVQHNFPRLEFRARRPTKVNRHYRSVVHRPIRAINVPSRSFSKLGIFMRLFNVAGHVADVPSTYNAKSPHLATRGYFRSNVRFTFAQHQFNFCSGLRISAIDAPASFAQRLFFCWRNDDISASYLDSGTLAA